MYLSAPPITSTYKKQDTTTTKSLVMDVICTEKDNVHTLSHNCRQYVLKTNPKGMDIMLEEKMIVISAKFPGS